MERLTLELETQGKELARRRSNPNYVFAFADSEAGYEGIQLEQTRLSELPAQIAELESKIEFLRSSHPSPIKSTNPNLNLSLPATLALLNERDLQSNSLDAQIRALQSSLPRKQRELERLESELHPLMNQKKTVVTQANEARQRREEGGVDEMEERGRWYRAADTTLKGALGVED